MLILDNYTDRTFDDSVGLNFEGPLSLIFKVEPDTINHSNIEGNGAYALGLETCASLG